MWCDPSRLDGSYRIVSQFTEFNICHRTINVKWNYFSLFDYSANKLSQRRSGFTLTALAINSTCGLQEGQKKLAKEESQIPNERSLSSGIIQHCYFSFVACRSFVSWQEEILWKGSEETSCRSLKFRRLLNLHECQTMNKLFSLNWRAKMLVWSPINPFALLATWFDYKL